LAACDGAAFMFQYCLKAAEPKCSSIFFNSVLWFHFIHVKCVILCCCVSLHVCRLLVGEMLLHVLKSVH